jgi:biotin-dependent carboxylase-like uncharacterized protein
MIEIVSPGIGSSFQDLGRPGCAHLGVGRSGAADRPSHRLANRLVGNPESAATIETYGGLRIRALQALAVVVTGAYGVIEVRHGPPMAVNAIAHVPAGAEMTLRPPDQGMRYYLAVRGGLEIAPVLGSRSLDTLAGIGPRLESGALIGIGPDPATEMATDLAVRHQPPNMVQVFEGPRRDWFTQQAWSVLTTAEFVVSPASNRVGVRLSGPALERCDQRQLPSEGIVEGAIEVPPDGQPIVMLADHPVTGGYPVIAVVMPKHLPSIAQARPGTTLRFRHRGG